MSGLLDPDIGKVPIGTPITAHRRGTNRFHQRWWPRLGYRPFDFEEFR